MRRGVRARQTASWGPAKKALGFVVRVVGATGWFKGGDRHDLIYDLKCADSKELKSQYFNLPPCEGTDFVFCETNLKYS